MNTGSPWAIQKPESYSTPERVSTWISISSDSVSFVRPWKSLRLEWHGWHGFRHGIPSNLYELGANDKVAQRILRHAKPHVTRERYIKAFDPAVLAAMKSMEAALDVVSKCSPTAYQVN